MFPCIAEKNENSILHLLYAGFCARKKNAFLGFERKIYTGFLCWPHTHNNQLVKHVRNNSKSEIFYRFNPMNTITLVAHAHAEKL